MADHFARLANHVGDAGGVLFEASVACVKHCLVVATPTSLSSAQLFRLAFRNSNSGNGLQTRIHCLLTNAAPAASLKRV